MKPIDSETHIMSKTNGARRFVQILRTGLLLVGLLFTTLTTGRAGVLVSGNEAAGWDWDQYCITVLDWSPPEGPGAYILNYYEEYRGPSGGDGGYYTNSKSIEFTEGATDWGSPYVAIRDLDAIAIFYYDVTNGDGEMGGDSQQSIGVANQLQYTGVNQGAGVNLTAQAGPHWRNPLFSPTNEYIHIEDVLNETEIGENPTVVGNPGNQTNFTWSPGSQTNASASTYSLVQVLPITFAFIGTNPPIVNLAPLPGCSGGGTFTSPLGSTPYVYSQLIFNSYIVPLSSTSNSLTTNYSTGTNSPTGYRSIIWYGSYADLLNGSATGFDATQVSRDYTDLSNYLAYTNGDVIGQLVTYSVVPFHPAFDTNVWGNNVSGYAFQVAMQLGSAMATQPIYSGSSSSNGPPVINGPPGSPIGTAPIYPPTSPGPPGAPITTTGSSTLISGFSISESNLTGDIQATLTAQNGILTLGTTNGLDAISGIGTSNLVIQGSLTNVNTDLATLTYQSNTNFSGYDIITIVVSDLGNNGTGTPEITTWTIQVIVTPALTGEAFVSGTNFQFNINGVNGPNWQVYTSTNLSNWTSLGNICPSNGTATFMDTNAGMYSQCFYQIGQDSMFSDAIGFINVTAPVGDSMLACQLLNPAGNTLPVIMSNAPNGTTVFKWDASTQDWGAYDFFNSAHGGWTVTNFTLNPGDAIWFENPTSNTVPFTFIGNVPLGPQSQTVLTNESAMSSIIPVSVDLGTLGFPLSAGGFFYRWNWTTQAYDTFEYGRGGWSPSPFTPNIGEAFLFSCSTNITTNQTWTESYTISP